MSGHSVWTSTRAAAAVVAIVIGVVLSHGRVIEAGAQAPWHAQYFPNLDLITHRGEHVRFYDLIKGKIVDIELMYTTSQNSCPLETARLAQVQTLLGDRMGTDVFFYSITIDPEHDTPSVLAAFAEKYQAGAGWTFLTGRADDIELLSKKLGLYSPPNPENQDGHMPTLLIGNETTGQWMRGSALDNPRLTATMLRTWVGGYAAASPVRSYAEAPAPRASSSGAYLFSTKCSACHTLGHGLAIGPDLAGVTRTRDRRWLASYLAAPDEMRKNGDPFATALATRYRGVTMPNLGLSREQIDDVILFLDQRQTENKQ